MTWPYHTYMEATMHSLPLHPRDARLLHHLVAAELVRVETESVRFVRERAHRLADTEDIDRYLSLLRQLAGELNQIAGDWSDAEAPHA